MYDWVLTNDPHKAIGLNQHQEWRFGPSLRTQGTAVI